MRVILLALLLRRVWEVGPHSVNGGGHQDVVLRTDILVCPHASLSIREGGVNMR